MSTPVQSLTSLDWYRQALDESSSGRRGMLARWLRGLSFLLFHVSLYAISIVVLFAIDLIRSPASLWIGKVALAWAALIVVHAAIVGLIWAIGLLREDQSNETDELQWSPPSSLKGWRTKSEEPQDAVFRMSAPSADVTETSPVTTPPLPEQPSPMTTAATFPAVAGPPFESWALPKPAASAAPSPSEPIGDPATPSSTKPDSLWSGWEPASAATIARQALEGDSSGERASWTEASAAAWLSRPSSTSDSSSIHPLPAPSPSDFDSFKQQLRTRLERRNAHSGNAQKPSGNEDSGKPPQ